MSKKSPDTIVTLVHGVMSHATGMEKLRDFLYKDNEFFPYPEVRVRVFNYRNFPAYISGMPFKRFRNIRDTYADYLGTYLKEQQCQYPNANLDVVAHSFGSWMLQQVLLLYPSVSLDRIVLLGSVMDVDFPWGRYCDCNRVADVYNFVGENDWVQFISSLPVVGMGASGRNGFKVQQPGRVENIYPDPAWSHLSYAEPKNLLKVKKKLQRDA